MVTIHRMRAPGMTWFRLPLFVWAQYATSIIILLSQRLSPVHGQVVVTAPGVQFPGLSRRGFVVVQKVAVRLVECCRDKPRPVMLFLRA